MWKFIEYLISSEFHLIFIKFDLHLYFTLQFLTTYIYFITNLPLNIVFYVHNLLLFLNLGYWIPGSNPFIFFFPINIDFVRFLCLIIFNLVLSCLTFSPLLYFLVVLVFN